MFFCGGWFRKNFYSKKNKELVIAMKNGDRTKIKEIYESFYPTFEDIIYSDELFENRVGLRLIANIVKSQMRGAKLKFCDMACGHGELLRELKKYGIECYGVEAAYQRVKYINKMGILCNYATVECCGYPDEIFDMVSCNECLEHVENPFFVMKEMYRILKPNGTIFVTVPFENELDCDGHVRQFGTMDLCLLANKSGFGNLKILKIPYLNHEKKNNLFLTGEKVVLENISNISSELCAEYNYQLN